MTKMVSRRVFCDDTGPTASRTSVHWNNQVRLLDQTLFDDAPWTKEELLAALDFWVHFPHHYESYIRVTEKAVTAATIELIVVGKMLDSYIPLENLGGSLVPGRRSICVRIRRSQHLFNESSLGTRCRYLRFDCETTLSCYSLLRWSNDYDDLNVDATAELYVDHFVLQSLYRAAVRKIPIELERIGLNCESFLVSSEIGERIFDGRNGILEQIIDHGAFRVSWHGACDWPDYALSVGDIGLTPTEIMALKESGRLIQRAQAKLKADLMSTKRLIKRTQLLNHTGKDNSTISKWKKRPNFPRPFGAEGSEEIYLLSEINQFLRDNGMEEIDATIR